MECEVIAHRVKVVLNMSNIVCLGIQTDHMPGSSSSPMRSLSPLMIIQSFIQALRQLITAVKLPKSMIYNQLQSGIFEDDSQHIILVLNALKVVTSSGLSFWFCKDRARSQWDNWVIHIGSTSAPNLSSRSKRVLQAESYPAEPNLTSAESELRTYLILTSVKKARFCSLISTSQSCSAYHLSSVLSSN